MSTIRRARRHFGRPVPTLITAEESRRLGNAVEEALANSDEYTKHNEHQRHYALMSLFKPKRKRRKVARP